MRLMLIVNQSLEAIRSNLFRAGVTMFIIALGITAIMIVMTSIEGIKTGLTSSFASLGTNTFSVTNKAGSLVRRGRGRDRRDYPPIEYREAIRFQEDFRDLAVTSVSKSGGNNFQVRFQDEETNPNVGLTGIDQHYFITARYELAEGRNITEEDVSLARNVIIIGNEIREILFPFESPIGKVVLIGGHGYTVVGLLKTFGTMGMGGADRTGFIPLTTLRNHFPGNNNVSLSVFVPEASMLDPYMAEARGAFRLARELGPKDPDNFSVVKSDEFVGQLLEQAGVLTLTAQIVALITLLGAAVALLNVMLVSVAERTSEIGLRKATGATRISILTQFLAEAIVICQIGGLAGIVLGLLGGNLVSSLIFEARFVVPWLWVGIGVIACLLVGVGAGMYPANKAAKVDPIESLRRA